MSQIHPHRPEPPPLSRRERELLEIIHRLGSPTLTEIIGHMHQPPVRAAVRTLLKVMERKGHIHHSKRSREFVFHANRSRDSEGRSLFRRLLTNFFDGSLTNAISSHFAATPESLKQSEIEEISNLLARLQQNTPRDPRE